MSSARTRSTPPAWRSPKCSRAMGWNLMAKTLIPAHLGRPFEIADGLHEHQREQVGWLSSQAFEQAVVTFFTRPDELVFGEETAHQAGTRFDAAVRGLLR